jgi:hypothetical protein
MTLKWRKYQQGIAWEEKDGISSLHITVSPWRKDIFFLKRTGV